MKFFATILAVVLGWSSAFGAATTGPSGTVSYTTIQNSGGATLNTNHIFITEHLPVASNTPAAYNDILGSYTYSSLYGGMLFDADQSALLYETNKAASGTRVFVINELGLGAVFLTTNNAGPLGPWYPTDVWFSNVGPTNILYGSYLSLPAAGTSQVARAASRITAPVRNAGILGGRPFVVMETGAVPNANDLTNTVNFIKANSLLGFVSVINQDVWTGGRDGNGNEIFDSTKFPGMTVAGYANYIHTNGLKVGLHADFGTYSPVGATAQQGSQGYYWQDATNLVANGIDWVLMDTTAAATPGENDDSDNVNEFVKDFHEAGIAYGKRIHVSGAFNGTFHQDFRSWMPVADSWWVEDDSASIGQMLRVANYSLAWNGYGQYMALNNPDATFTNVAGSQKLFGLLSILPANLKVETNFFSTAVFSTCTNQEMLDIWWDAAGNPGYLLTSNLSGQVWGRLLGNGDYAVYFLNTSNGVNSSLVANWTDLRIATNLVMNCRDVFNGTNLVTPLSLGCTLPASGGTLFRLSQGQVVTLNPLTIAVPYAPNMDGLLSVNLEVTNSVTVLGAYLVTNNFTHETFSGTNEFNIGGTNDVDLVIPIGRGESVTVSNLNGTTIKRSSWRTVR